jgi:uncharacterized protein (DUF488 family)
MPTNTRPRIFTIGHSTLTTRELVSILDSQKLKLLIDVRTIPKSRHNPQFGQARISKSLDKHGIQYRHMPGLGGLRRPRKDSPNMAWRNLSFRGYADYMMTEEFKMNLHKLIARSKRQRLVIMCAEAVPWRCHRSLIADALLALGYEVSDLIGFNPPRRHKMTAFAKVRKGEVRYPL